MAAVATANDEKTVGPYWATLAALAAAQLGMILVSYCGLLGGTITLETYNALVMATGIEIAFLWVALFAYPIGQTMPLWLLMMQGGHVGLGPPIIISVAARFGVELLGIR